MNELQALQNEAEEAKRQLTSITLVKTQAPKENEEKMRKQLSAEIASLENQISELTSMTREELRDARAKIEESITAVEIRRKAHENEIKKLNDEIQQRSLKYSEHIEALKQQYNLEIQSIKESIATTESKVENTERMIDQLEKHHQTQLTEAFSDYEMTKRTYSQHSSRQVDAQMIKSNLREIQRIKDECRALTEEGKFIDNEIAQLEEENKNLEQELAHLQLTLHRNN